MSSSVIEVIEKRKSVRTYETTPLDEVVHTSIMDYLNNEEKLAGPLGGRADIEWIWAKGEGNDKGIKLGAYGIIKNPQAYLVGRIKNDKQSLLEFGYIFQKLILYATGLGLGTCWIGGTFNRNSFAREIKLGDDELIPCITPVGYAREKHSVVESTMRFVVKADQRKPWSELFYDSEFKVELTREEAGNLAVPLEMVRLGPSASNKQPWRVVLSPDRKHAHFYLVMTPNYSGNKVGFEMQRIDVGIAACDFELACQELDISGSWIMSDPLLEAPQAEYMLSYAIK